MQGGSADRRDDVGVGGDPARRDVVGAVAQVRGGLQQGDRAAGVLDVAQVEPVAEARLGEQGRQVKGLAAGRRLDERGRREERVLVAERSPGAGDPQVDDLDAGRLGQLLAEQLADLLRPRDRMRGGEPHRQVLGQRAPRLDAAVDPDHARQTHPAHALGYLLKHAHLALEQRTDAVLADLGLTARDLGVLRVIASGEARSQQEAATVLGVDRTSMVALLDALERRGIVARKPSELDRRRNAVELTHDGRSLFQRAEQRSTEAEQAFTATLGHAGAAGLRQALKTVLDASGRS